VRKERCEVKVNERAIRRAVGETHVRVRGAEKGMRVDERMRGVHKERP
jgi:hypothetical protein